jgi:hypothetical protein
MIPQERPTKMDADKMYAQYVKPLEDQHQGEFIAVSPKGQTLFAPSIAEALLQGSKQFGKGNFIFKVGEKAVGKLL